jgi:hypothetical protein
MEMTWFELTLMILFNAALCLTLPRILTLFDKAFFL